MTEEAVLTVETAQARFLDYINRDTTRQVYRYGLDALQRFIKETDYAGFGDAPCPVASLRDDLVVGFYHWLTEQYDTPHTVQTYLAAVQRLLVWLDAENLLPLEFQLGKAQSRLKAAQGERGPGGYRHHRPDPELPKIITYYDHLELPEAVDAKSRLQRLVILRNRAIVHTLYASAGRVSEVAALTREQVMDGRQDEVQIVGKGDKTRMILLTTQAMQTIRAYLKERLDDAPGLFISHSRRTSGQTLNRKTIWQVVKEAATALDLHESTSPHDFRHFRATQLLNKGMPLELVQAYLGHTDIATTRKIYAHTRTSVLRQQLAAFDETPEEALAELEKRRSRSSVPPSDTPDA